MADVIRLEDRRRKANVDAHIVIKLVNGMPMRCVNVDALSPAQFEEFFAAPDTQIETPPR